MGRAGDLMFANLMNRGETIKLKELNAAFQSPQLIGVGHYQASLVVKHIVERFGHEVPLTGQRSRQGHGRRVGVEGPP